MGDVLTGRCELSSQQHLQKAVTETKSPDFSDLESLYLHCCSREG